jgi:hypothetical protein
MVVASVSSPAAEKATSLDNAAHPDRDSRLSGPNAERIILMLEVPAIDSTLRQHGRTAAIDEPFGAPRALVSGAEGVGRAPARIGSDSSPSFERRRAGVT